MCNKDYDLKHLELSYTLPVPATTMVIEIKDKKFLCLGIYCLWKMQINNHPQKLPSPVSVPISCVATRLPFAVVEQA